MTNWLSNKQWLALLFVAIVACYANLQAYNAADKANDSIAQIREEGTERRGQICLQAEREHLNSVNSLKNTYLYLLNLSTEERGSTFNRFIIAQVPRTEDEANNDVAPDFCDEPGVEAEKLYERTGGKEGSPPIGLPEPDPVVPKRPKRVDELIKHVAESGPVLKLKGR